MGQGTDGSTIGRHQRVLLNAVEWYHDRIKRQRPDSAAADPEYEQFTALKIAIRNSRGVFDDAHPLLWKIVKQRREYLQREALDEGSIGVDKKKLLDELTELDQFMDEIS